jgi:putative endonuclease
MARRRFYVYILASLTRTLYTGVTNNLERRLAAHKAGTGSVFTARYHVNRLVHMEEFSDVREAIAREKQIKGLNRAKRIALIEVENPHWDDLARELDGWQGVAPETDEI